jgi:DNA-binding NtrC family response regulator
MENKTMHSEQMATPARHLPPDAAHSLTSPHDRDEPARATALVVDDEMLIRWAISELLQELGFDVQQAGDARSALEAIAHRDRFELVMLDVRLPDSHDLALLTRIRALLPEARVIVLTAHGNRELFEEAMALGAHSVVSKPFELSILAEAISRERGSPP